MMIVMVMMMMMMMMMMMIRTITRAVTEVRSKFEDTAAVIMKMFTWRESVYFGTFGKARLRSTWEQRVLGNI